MLVTLVDLSGTVAVLVRTDLRWLGATLLMVPIQVMLRTARWRLLLPRRTDGSRPALLRVMPALLVGLLANLVLPARLGEPVRAYLVSRRERLSLARVLGSVLLERVIDLASLAFVAVLAAVLVGAPGWLVRGTGTVALIGLLLVVLLVISAMPRLLRLLTRLAGEGAERLSAMVDVLLRFGEGAGGAGRQALAGAAVLSTVTWFFVAATFWLLGQALDLEVTPAGALLIAAVGTLGTAIPSAPAYIGTFELAIVVAAGALGIPGEQALALALLSHAVVTVPFVLAGGAAMAGMSLSLAKVAGEATAAWRDRRRAAELP